MSDGVMVCQSMCWPCIFDEHQEPPRWHTWADDDDVEHAKATQQPDPRETRCGCHCADAPKPASDTDRSSSPPAAR